MSSCLKLINLLIIVRESFLRLNELNWSYTQEIFVMTPEVSVDMLSSHCLFTLATREELLGLPQGTRVAHVRRRPVACLGLWPDLSTRDELSDLENIENS